MTAHLFHSIGPNSEESAKVRKFIVDRNLQEQIEFHNVAYEESQKLLKTMSGQTQVPCLVKDNEVIVGATAILDILGKV